MMRMDCELGNGNTAKVFYNSYYGEYQVDIMAGDTPVMCVGWYQTFTGATNALQSYADARGLELRVL